MSEVYQVIATPVFKTTVKQWHSFLRRKYGIETADQTLELVKQHTAKLSAQPYIAPLSERLAVLGFTGYRQLVIDRRNLVFYRIDEQSKKVVLIALMDSRQSVEQLLFDVLMLY